ncbi:MAG TPA: efflux RND transporter periplasmic adaptor subunit [Gemmatimonadales bacterium]|jgi:RND family efflux transporter MFP subunit
MSRARFVPIVLVIAACSGAAGKSLPADREPAPLVRVTPVTEATITPPVIATGILGPKEEVALGFKIGGVIARVLVDAGASVSTGDTLAALDLSEIDAAVARAQSAADNAERDLGRARRLYGDSVVTLSQLQDAETGATAAQSDLETARFNRRYALIIAPSSGVILRRDKEPGELVAPGAPVLVLGSSARGAVLRAGLADRDVVRVRLGDSAVVRFDALPDGEFVGRVSEIAAAADPMTGTYRVEVRLPATVGLASGLVGQVEIQPRATRPVLLVPLDALLEADNDRATLFVWTNGHAERREVRIAFLAGERAAVSAGLDSRERVITEGAAYLRDGERVSVRGQP